MAHWPTPPAQVLVSACLLGERCRYDGRQALNQAVVDYLRAFTPVPVCPEVLGGLPVPRLGCDLADGDGAAVWAGNARVMRRDGADCTEAYRLGAERCLAAAPQATFAVLKARSPSCGCHRTWIDGAVRPGMGVFAALLHAHGVDLASDEDILAANAADEPPRSVPDPAD